MARLSDTDVQQIDEILQEVREFEPKIDEKLDEKIRALAGMRVTNQFEAMNKGLSCASAVLQQLADARDAQIKKLRSAQAPDDIIDGVNQVFANLYDICRRIIEEIAPSVRQVAMPLASALKFTIEMKNELAKVGVERNQETINVYRTKAQKGFESGRIDFGMIDKIKALQGDVENLADLVKAQLQKVKAWEDRSKNGQKKYRNMGLVAGLSVLTLVGAGALIAASVVTGGAAAPIAGMICASAAAEFGIGAAGLFAVGAATAIGVHAYQKYQEAKEDKELAQKTAIQMQAVKDMTTKYEKLIGNLRSMTAEAMAMSNYLDFLSKTDLGDNLELDAMVAGLEMSDLQHFYKNLVDLKNTLESLVDLAIKTIQDLTKQPDFESRPMPTTAKQGGGCVVS
eukprot:TRINITY_DN80644_c0_g1_i1.p1 TRINITY_DN80644_c0_g1~~TRINITY_DN80644_c0_g1_i1.p1  ORF type:complete len:426 (+),score=90.96 TRINITY_DN80644_c0_g1_i1:85-1278(+)